MAIVLLFTGTAMAGDIRAGFGFQDVQIGGAGGVKEKEKGNAITLEYVADSPDFLEWALKARPYIGGTFNVSGDTSYAGAGLLWDTTLFGPLTGEISFGPVIHDGELEIPSPGEATTVEQALEFERLNAENIEFGSRVLFRSQFALGLQVREGLLIQGYYEHLSNGKIFTSGSNEGLDSFGVRVGTRV